jgi:hypothetical protein
MQLAIFTSTAYDFLVVKVWRLKNGVCNLWCRALKLDRSIEVQANEDSSITNGRVVSGSGSVASEGILWSSRRSASKGLRAAARIEKQGGSWPRLTQTSARKWRFYALDPKDMGKVDA